MVVEHYRLNALWKYLISRGINLSIMNSISILMGKCDLFGYLCFYFHRELKGELLFSESNLLILKFLSLFLFNPEIC